MNPNLVSSLLDYIKENNFQSFEKKLQTLTPNEVSELYSSLINQIIRKDRFLFFQLLQQSLESVFIYDFWTVKEAMDYHRYDMVKYLIQLKKYSGKRLSIESIEYIMSSLENICDEKLVTSLIQQSDVWRELIFSQNYNERLGLDCDYKYRRMRYYVPQLKASFN